MYKKLTNKGIGLIEVILSLGIAIVVITSLVSLAVFTLRASQQSKFLLESSKLAAEEIELVRAYKDSVPWATFIASMTACSSACHIDDSGTPLTVSSGDETIDGFMDRSFSAAQAGSDQIYTITSTISWTFGTTTKTTVLVSQVSNWKK